MDYRLEFVISQKNYNLSTETIAVLEEYLSQNPNVSKEQLLERFEWISSLKP